MDASATAAGTTTATGAVEVQLRLRRDAQLERTADGRLVLVEGHVRMPLPPLGAGVAAAVELIGAGGGPDGGAGSSEDDLLGVALAADGHEGILRLQMLLGRLQTGGWLEKAVVHGGAPVATLRPVGHVLAAATRVLRADQPVQLSRFALLRAEGGEARLETPLAALDVTLHDPRLGAAVAALARPLAPADVEVPGIPAEVVYAVLQLLLDASLLALPGQEDRRELAQWAFADLLFHARSRVGRNLGGYGGTFHQEGRFDALPGVKPHDGEPAVRLPRPDLAAVAAADPPLTTALEERRSIREHDDARPLTAAQLGEFLWRTARLRRAFRDQREELSNRPYPAGGAIYEIELYPLVQNVAGVEPGLYHYDPEGHALHLVAAPGPKLQLLLEYAKRTGNMQAYPQVTLLLAARFGRVMWKYESMAYALVLKHVGVLYQTMYLVATAMGLAPCALGGGNSDAFAIASDIDYYAETTVGEFLLGSAPSTKES